MNDFALWSGVIIFSYVIGSVTGAYYVVKFFLKQDIRFLESGVVGATNAGRVLGKKGFLLTLAIDGVKVWIVLWVVSIWTAGDEWFLLCSSLFLLVGHLYPVQLKFHGGKGIVVFLAAAFYFSPLTIVVMGLLMGLIYLFIKRYTISGFISMASIPLTAYLTMGSLIIPVGLLVLYVYIAAIHQR